MITTSTRRTGLLLVVMVGLVTTSAVAQNPFTFSLVEQQATPSMFGSQEWIDLDGDGDLDLVSTGNATNLSLPVVESYQTTTLRVWERQTDSGSIIQAVDYSSEQISTVQLWLSGSDWFDADNDGDLDLFVSGSSEELPPYQSRAVVITNDNGILSSTEISVPATYSGAVSAADVDNDGDRDILLTGFSDAGDPSMRLYMNTGAFTFQDAGLDLPGYALGGSDFGDYDNDGDADLVVSGRAEDGGIRLAIFDNDGAGAFTLSTDRLEGLLYGSVSWGDYDQDGDLDILSNGGRLSPFIMTGVTQVLTNNGGTFSSPPIEFEGAAHGAAQWADFDHDGDLDVLIAGAREVVGIDSHGRLYLNNGSTFTHVSNIAVPFPATLSLGDYDNDDDIDVSIGGLSDRNLPIFLQYENRNLVVNNVPAPPLASGSQVNGGLVTLNWQPSEDVETASTGLTYAVRVGTQPGSSDVMSTPAMSDDGKRTTTSFGNVYQNTSWTLDLPNGIYYWAVQAVDNGFVGSPFSTEQSFTVSESGKGTPTSTEDPDGAVRFSVRDAYPNPFHDATTVDVYLPTPAEFTFEIYDALGRRVSQEFTRDGWSGLNVVSWDATADSGSRVGSGVYFVRVSSPFGTSTKTVVVQ